MGYVIDAVTLADSATTPLPVLAAGLTGVFVVGGAANFTRSYLLGVIGESVTAKLRADTYASLLGKDLGFFDASRTGELVNRLAADTTLIGKTLSDNVSQGLRSVAQAIGAVGAMYAISPALTGVMLAIVPPMALGARSYGRYVRGLSKEVQDLLGHATELADERLSAIRTVRLFGQEAAEHAAYAGRVQTAFEAARRRAMANGLFFGGVDFGVKMSMLGVLYLGGNMVADGALTVGQLSSFLLYTLYVGFSTAGLSSFYADLNKGIGASQRVFDLLSPGTASPTATPIPDRPHGGPPTTRPGAQAPPASGDHPAVQLDAVHFAYPTREDAPVLRGMSLAVRPGETLALVGASGSGKTTVGHLLARLYDVRDGRGTVSVDGVDVRGLDPAWLRARIGTVSQEPVLFAGSIRDNIVYGAAAQPTQEELERCARDANAHDFIASLPNGYDTVVGERGQTLSGGQKQRIAIARALLRDPHILILDEATSALDPESERQVQEAMDRLRRGRTAVVVSHRTSSMQHADRVAVLAHGRVVETGTFDGLYADTSSALHKLVKSNFANDPVTNSD